MIDRSEIFSLTITKININFSFKFQKKVEYISGQKMKNNMPEINLVYNIFIQLIVIT